MAGIRIKSNNFNGESVQITFNPFSGGTINLGTQTIPYDYLSSNYEGNYSIYIPSADKTCPLQVGTPPPPVFYHIEAQNGDLIITQGGDFIDWFPL
jgi:hypothetical protein